MKRLALAVAALLASLGAALAQSTVTVIGPVTPGNVPQFSSTTIIKDSGIPAGSSVTGPGSSTLNDCAIWNNTTGTKLADAPCVLISMLGAGVLTALETNIGSTGAPVLFNGALGAPSSGSLGSGVTLGGVIMGLGSDATGDIYYNNAGVLARLPIGTTGQSLQVTAGKPAWGSAGAGNVSNTGTPTANQIAQWTNATTVQGVNLASLLVAGTGISLSGTTTVTVNQSLTNATLQASPTNPSAITSGTGLMLGLGGTCKITPVYSTRIKVEFFGSMAGSTLGASETVKVFFGTGAAPSNGAAITGTQIGNSTVIDQAVAVDRSAFANGGIVTGLTPGTAYWLDLSAASGSGSNTVTSVSCNAMEF